MKDRTEIEYGRYKIIAGTLNGNIKAVALFGKSKIDEAQGQSIDSVIVKIKEILDRIERERASQRRAPHIGTVEEYKEAIEHISMSSAERLMITSHAISVDRKMTAAELAKAGEYDSYSTANSIYGTLAKKIGNWIGLAAKDSEIRSNDVTFTFYLAEGEYNDADNWVWIMHPEVHEALSLLNMV
ncbi:MAG TPA: hypothetical protein DFI00_03755 [Rhodospirillaceae bacterium]|nr:hypothetical protein [Alphaproteobacteria bacterium]OUT42540.1 MAG: hypothetical protein CBB62_09850 [Micavibrio sp. TMED2]HCI46389.1 hypothetical protein [Rhodospirillaceae bacterium]MAS45796.1 hypothetical protein [Alphaproteobacteria bacterium]MAX96021.1 hypothetical protein [Alphaproteobacteria bacterium]|tara:strand:+ start:3212 stop:3766 length:555 start_codon:yes stop_codon:yes gene_type:complete